MSGVGEQAVRKPGGGFWGRLPAPLRPRDEEQRGLGQLRLVETTVLVLAALVLVTATIYDLGRQTRVNVRLRADLRTWRQYTGYRYSETSVDTNVLGLTSQREVVCGGTTPGKLEQRTELCLMIWGPTRDGVRQVHGGWYLPVHAEVDEPLLRYGCFGLAARERFCPR